MLYAPSAPYSLPKPDRFNNSEARPPSSPPSMSSIRQLVLLDITAVFYAIWSVKHVSLKSLIPHGPVRPINDQLRKKSPKKSGNNAKTLAK